MFYLETAQWLLSFDNFENKNDDKYQQVWCENITFPENAPKSRIVNSTQRMAEVLPALNGASNSVKVDVNGMIVRKSELKYKDLQNPKTNENGDQVLVEIEMETEMKITDNPSTPDTMHEEKATAKTDYDHLYYLQSIRLFRKYIANDSYFTINVSSKVRSNLYHLLGYNENDKINEEDLVTNLKSNLKTNENRNNIKATNGASQKEPDMVRVRSKSSHHNDRNIDDLFHIFDIPRSETFQLMNYAVSRFKHTKRYKAWIASKKQKK